MNNILETYFENRILPAVTLERREDALNTAKALLEGGLNVMEITFRTEAAAASIKEISDNAGDMMIGAGTVLTREQVREAKKAGARFGLSPGLNPAVVKEARKIDFPFIPGIITPSEVEQALELGCTVLKLFPAESSGGVSRLKALAGPYRHAGISFIPMGGINMDNLGQYLARPEVTAAGGSWLASKEFIQKQEFEKITENAKKSLKISQKFL